MIPASSLSISLSSFPTLLKFLYLSLAGTTIWPTPFSPQSSSPYIRICALELSVIMELNCLQMKRHRNLVYMWRENLISLNTEYLRFWWVDLLSSEVVDHTETRFIAEKWHLVLMSLKKTSLAAVYVNIISSARIAFLWTFWWTDLWLGFRKSWMSSCE